MIHGKNHACYVDFQVFYNIVRYLKDFKEYFIALYHVGVGQLCIHITAEVDCESMFSQEGFIYDPMRAITGILVFKCLVVVKHFLNCINLYIPIFKVIFMKQWKENLGGWGELNVTIENSHYWRQ